MRRPVEAFQPDRAFHQQAEAKRCRRIVCALFRSAALGRPPQLGSFVTGFGRQCSLRLDIASRGREILLQSACAVAFLLEGFAQIR